MLNLIKKMLLIAVLCLPWVTNAQTHYNMQIGTGTSTSQYVPDYSYYNYSYTQMLYTAAEVGIDGEIDTLAFQVSSGSSSRTLTVYMAEVSQTNLSSQVAASELHQVFSGTVSWSAGWVTIPLDSVFEYQGTGSLVIAFIDATGTWASGYPYFSGTTMSETRSKYVYNDNNPYMTSSSLSYSASFLPNIRLGINSYSSYCAAPSNVTISNINNDEADISWTENGGATEWEIIISDSAITDFANASSFTTTSNPYTVNGLGSNTLYYVYVRAVCDASSYSVWTPAASFRSACTGYTTIPYTTGFEELSTGAIPNCWQQLAMGSSSASTFPAAYVWQPNARNSNVYFEFESSSGETEIAALPAMDNISSLMLTFYASCMNTNFTLEAGVIEGSAFVPVQTVQLTAGTGGNWAGSYYPYTVYYGGYTGSSERMALRVTANAGTSYTLMIDDLTVDYLPSCPEPTNLNLDSVGTDWAAISWIENGTASSWVLEYDTVDFIPGAGTAASSQTVQSTEQLLTGLDSGYTYYVYVRSNCGGDTSVYTSLTFNTLAGAPATIPYICDFEGGGVNGWELINGTQANQWVVGNAVNNGGSRSLYISDNGGTSNNYNLSSTSYVFATRTIQLNEAGEYVYSFDWRADGESSFDFIRAALVPFSTQLNAGSYSGFNNSTDVPSGGIALDGPGRLNQHSSWQTRTGTFVINNAGTYMIVFMWRNDASSGTQPPAAIDNVQIVRNTCPAPYGLAVTGVTTTDVTVNWNAGGSETSWEVSDGVNNYLSSDTTYTITGLTPDHQYNIRVRAICDIDDTSMSISTTARTLQSCVRPTGIAVDSVLGDTVWVSWTDTTNAYTFDLAFGYSGFDPDTAVVNVIYGVTDTHSYMFTGLTMGQRYDFYVRIDCSSEQSSWVGPASAVPSYTYNMAATGSDTLHVCGYTIYDDGGELGNYSGNCNSTLVVFPNDPTMTIQISGTGNVESGYDHLYIYDGVGTAGTMLFHGQGAFTMPATNSESGAVTIVFTSDGSVNYAGFELSVACVPLPECPHPSQLVVNNVGIQTAEISWVELGSATEWIVQYDTVNFTPGANTTANSILVTTNPYTLTGLDSGMTYYVYVAAFCNPDTSDYISTNFTTLAASPATLPYSCDFEQPGVNGWDLISGTQTNHWMVGTAASNGGNQGLYVTNDGSSNAYTTSSLSYSYAVRALNLSDPGEYAYSYDWKGMGESHYYDFTRVFITPASETFVAGSVLGGNTYSFSTATCPAGWLELTQSGATPNTLAQQSTWTTVTGTFSITNPGNYKMVFVWANDGSGGTNPPTAIDNVMLTQLNCPSPVNLTVTRFTSDSVFLAWNGNGATGPWLLTYDNISTTVYDSTVAIGGLSSGTQYTFSIATLCGSDTSFTTSVQITPGSWTMRPNQTDTLYMCGGIIYDDGGANGTYSANQNSTIILRPDTPSTLISISGTYYTESSWDYLTVYDGIGTGGTMLWTDQNSTNMQPFGPIESTSGPLTIVFHSDGSVQHDGFTINVSCITTSCRVMNLALDANVAESSSQLAITWDAVTDAQQYQIEYGVAGFELGQGQTMTSMTNSAVITGLTAMTNYDVYVRSICFGGETGSWARSTFRTAMCDNPVIVYNYDSTMNATTTDYAPIGYSYYEYSYVQTLIPASRLNDISGEITAFAFNVTYPDGGDQFDNMTVWMANVADTSLEDGPIVPDNDHIFQKVIDDADFNFGNNTGWMLYSFDTAFVWDGQSSILLAVRRNNGDYDGMSGFAAHSTSNVMTLYYYQDYYAIDYTDPDADNSGALNLAADIQFISCGGGCARPGGLNASNVNYGGATLNWSGSATEYEVSVKAATDGVWPAEVAVGNTHTYNVTGLSAATQYQYRVRAICDASENLISDWVMGTFVTDSLPCFEPSDLQATELGVTSATFAWTAGGAENMWSIHVWNSGFNEEYTATSNPFTVTGLTQTTTYFAAVKALCGNGAAESEYSDTIQFTTTSCGEVTGVVVNEVTATTAKVNWNAGTASSYEVEYGEYGYGAGQGHTEVVQGTTYNITGLESETQYSVRVRAFCSAGVMGPWTDPVDFTTGNDGINVADGMNVSIYPNPTSSNTTIALSGVNGDVTITIVDMNGRVVMSDSMSCEGDCVKTMEVSGLAQGAYFVRVNGENVNMVKKLVVK